MSRQPASCVLFDLDGTLIDSAPDLAAAVNAVLASRGRPAHSVDAVRNMIGRGGWELVRSALGRDDNTGRDDHEVNTAYDEFREHYFACVDRDSVPFPGVEEVLATLQDRGLRLAVVTNKPAAFTEKLLEARGLAARFDIIVSGDTLPVMKPDPAPLLHAARHCRAVPQATVMVGDSIFDIDAARNAGMRSIWLSYGYCHGQDIDAAAPDVRLDHFGDIPDHL